MSYLSEVIADAPRHYWRCADPSGGMAHSVGTDRNPLLSTPAFGSLGYTGVNADGGGAHTSDAISFNSAVLPSIGASFSCECWFWSAGPAGSNRSIYGFDGGAAPAVQAVVLTTGFLNLIYSTNTLASAAAITQFAWHHIVQTYDGTNHRGYLDGILMGPGAVASGGAFAHAFYLGRNVSTARFSGAVAEVAVYPTVLSAARVTAHFLAADFASSRPVWRQGGSQYPNVDSGLGISDLAQEILDSVRKTF